MKFLSSVDSWHSVFEWSSVILVAATVVAGAGAIITSRIINKRQEEKILGLDKANIASQKELESERIKRLEIESKVASRRLTGEQKSTLIKLLSNEPKTVKVISALLDSEGSDFADDFASALREAGWKGVVNKVNLSNEYGIQVAGVGWANKPFADKLGNALTEIGIEYRSKMYRPSEEEKEPIDIYLVIEHKPPPVF